MHRHSAGDKRRTNKPFRFFRIILDNTSTAKQLVLPKKFTSLHGHELPDSGSVTLVLPRGCEWNIGLKKLNGKIYLERGWPEFWSHYSIRIGHLLVFKYLGDSKFRVIMFDDTTTEVDEYPPLAVDHRSPATTAERGETSNKKAKVTGVGIGRTKSDIFRVTERLSQQQKNECLAMASGFNPNKPHFKVVMQASYVTRSRLSVPTNFANLHLHGNCDVRLKAGSSGRFWAMKYSDGFYNSNQPHRTAKFHSGWKSFAQDNGLDIGDVCVFVLTNNRDQISFDVKIFRAKENNSSPSDESIGHDSDSDSDSGYESETDDDLYSPTSSSEEE